MKNTPERRIILPKSQVDFEEQYADCMKQIRDLIEANELLVIQQSFFITSHTNAEYLERQQKIHEEVHKLYTFIPSTSIIAQSPAMGIRVSAELILVRHNSDERISFKEEMGIHYVLIESDESRQLYAGGISVKAPNDDFILQVNQTYSLLKSILEKESFSFSDIVRQWNYVENILSIVEQKGEHIQNYQVLNDIRSKFYSAAEFKNGYPAATGIGMNSGGLVLEIYAVKPLIKLPVISIKNPKQIDAYHYSDDVLVGNSTEKSQHKATPKFERAKYINIGGVHTLYISGTASIEKERTIGEDDIALQTRTTISNISELISESNLKQSGIIIGRKKINYSFIRVYIKNESDTQLVQAICQKYFDLLPVHYLIADVCRENLLVEIEGVATLI